LKENLPIAEPFVTACPLDLEPLAPFKISGSLDLTAEEEKLE